MGEPFFDEDDVVVAGEFSNESGSSAWDDSDAVYLQLDFGAPDDLDDELS
jgi:hypothetical protein